MTDRVVDHSKLETSDEWSLTTDQMVFMLRHQNAIYTAFAADDMETLRALAASEEFKTIFGTMSFDEAVDRYECALELKDANT